MAKYQAGQRVKVSYFVECVDEEGNDDGAQEMQETGTIKNVYPNGRLLIECDDRTLTELNPNHEHTTIELV
jgi:hypothetical protein